MGPEGYPLCRTTLLPADLRRMDVTRIPERVTCIRCLKTLRNVGLVAEGLLRAAGEAA
jgi:hypothetical protein